MCSKEQKLAWGSDGWSAWYGFHHIDVLFCNIKYCDVRTLVKVAFQFGMVLNFLSPISLGFAWRRRRRDWIELSDLCLRMKRREGGLSLLLPWLVWLVSRIACLEYCTYDYFRCFTGFSSALFEIHAYMCCVQLYIFSIIADKTPFEALHKKYHVCYCAERGEYVFSD